MWPIRSYLLKKSLMENFIFVQCWYILEYSVSFLKTMVDAFIWILWNFSGQFFKERLRPIGSAFSKTKSVLSENSKKVNQVTNSHLRCSMKKDALKNFAKFTEKHLYQSLLRQNIFYIFLKAVSHKNILGKFLNSLFQEWFSYSNTGNIKNQHSVESDLVPYLRATDL